MRCRCRKVSPFATENTVAFTRFKNRNPRGGRVGDRPAARQFSGPAVTRARPSVGRPNELPPSEIRVGNARVTAPTVAKSIRNKRTRGVYVYKSKYSVVNESVCDVHVLTDNKNNRL